MKTYKTERRKYRQNLYFLRCFFTMEWEYGIICKNAINVVKRNEEDTWYC